MKLALLILLIIFITWMVTHKPGLSIFSDDIVPVRDGELIDLNQR